MATNIDSKNLRIRIDKAVNRLGGMVYSDHLFFVKKTKVCADVLDALNSLQPVHEKDPKGQEQVYYKLDQSKMEGLKEVLGDFNQ